MYTILTVLGFIGQALAPIHELGHVIFGLLSGNPTKIIAWNMAQASRDGVIMSLGGYAFEFILSGALAWKFRKHIAVILLCGVYTASTFYGITGQGDALGQYHDICMVVWYGLGIFNILILITALVKRAEEKAVKAEAEAAAARQREILCRQKAKATVCSTRSSRTTRASMPQSSRNLLLFRD